MALNIQDFQRIAGAANFGTRNIVVTGAGNEAAISLGKVGRWSISKADKALNANTMAAFRDALSKQFGTLGEHAFDTVLGTRTQLGKALRKSDIEKTFSQLESVKRMQLKNEIIRLADTSPKVMSRGNSLGKLIATSITDAKLRWLVGRDDVSLDQIKAKAAMYVDEIVKEFDRARGVVGGNPLAAPDEGPLNVMDTDPMGLSRLDEVAFKSDETSVEDRVKSGQIGVGMRVNLSSTSPLLFEKLKTNGVEPGFIVRKDWSAADTRSLMADALTEGSRMGMEGSAAEVLQYGVLRGPGIPASIAFAAETIMMRDLWNDDTPIGKAFAEKFPADKFPDFTKDNLFPTDIAAVTPDRADKIRQVKEELFAQIRDVLMAKPKDDQPLLCKKFAERHIVKLDYNQGDRVMGKAIKRGSVGIMRLPERCLVKGGSFKGFFFRNFRLTSANEASAGAVAEAFANDLTRLAGVAAQELSIVRGSYSDGHTKLMLQAKFADGYRDFEDHYIKDGRIENPDENVPLESLGRYKAMFLLLADRDAIGSHGQNKGFRNGKFFAIDPGHSLEGNGKDLEIHDDLSFKDTSVNLLEKRFLNFSVFDDSTRFEKFEGILNIRNLRDSGKVEELFRDYCEAFDPAEAPEGDKKLCKMITERLDSMKKEFDDQMNRMLDIFEPQLKLYDALIEGPGGNQETGRNAIETLSNLEKATSPTTRMSAHNKVRLTHLEVIQKTRVAWSGTVENGAITYTSSKPLSANAKAQLMQLLGEGLRDVMRQDAATGLTQIVLTAENRDAAFAALSEDNVIQMKEQAPV